MIKCNLCTKFSIEKFELDEVQQNKGKIRQALDTLVTKIGGEKARKKLEDKFKNKDDIVLQHIKGKIMSHLSTRHLPYVIKAFPKIKSKKSDKGWKAIKSAFYFNWDGLIEYGIEE